MQYVRVAAQIYRFHLGARFVCVTASVGKSKRETYTHKANRVRLVCICSFVHSFNRASTVRSH